MKVLIIWLICGASLVGAFVTDWRAAGLMFVAAWANNMLGALRARAQQVHP